MHGNLSLFSYPNSGKVKQSNSAPKAEKVSDNSNEPDLPGNNPAKERSKEVKCYIMDTFYSTETDTDRVKEFKLAESSKIFKQSVDAGYNFPLVSSFDSIPSGS